MDELQAKIDKLPSWARQHIKELKLRAEPNVEEIARLRGEVEQLKRINRKRQDQIEAMLHMFQCAAKGGNEVAQAVQRIVDDYLVSGYE